LFKLVIQIVLNVLSIWNGGMMDQVYVEELGKHVAQTVTIKGWVYNTRSSGKLQFVLVRDGTGIVQCTAYKPDLPEELFERCEHLSQETSVMVSGEVRADKRAPGGYEIGLKDLAVIGESRDYPITPKEHGTGFLMENRHLWLRSTKQWAVLRVRSELIKALRDFFDDRGFVMFDTPIITPAACEGTTTLFDVEYFGEKAYLAQSGQLYGEAGAMAFGKIYCFGPTFRAEKSKTRRHLTEFWMLEPEVAYADLDDVVQLAEDMTVYIVERCLEKCKRELEVLERDTSKLETIKPPFPRLRYRDALKKLEELGEPLEWGGDFGSPHETALADCYDRPVFVTHFPAQVKAFYMEPDEEDPAYVKCVDMLAPEGYGEIIGGSQRIHDLDLLEKKIEEHGLPRKAFEWYLDLRRYGTVPHGGFGLGLERTVTWICGIHHLREAIPFPRMLETLYP
jgi:asparaginyl-tRNA synthetase